jgi:hypothetical protein
LEDGPVKERLIAAFKQKNSASYWYQGMFPIYVVRYQLKGKASPGERKISVIARIEAEPAYSTMGAGAGTTAPVTLALWLLRNRYANFTLGIPLTSFYLAYE